jgi:undecaprenyl-diphosphatase
MSSILDWDRDLLLWLNSFHTDWLDSMMYWITRTFVWTPLYMFLIVLVIQKYKKESWIILLGAALVVIFCDQTTSTFMKPFFARLRPSQEPSLQGIIHLVNGYTGGKYGFASGHAANTFGTALFVWLTLRSYYKWIALIFIWAMLMTYTRIYLGVHYPTDILVGGAIGLFYGWLSFKLTQWAIQKKRVRQTPDPLS